MPKSATVGCIKPTRNSGSHGDLEKLLPDGIETIVRHFDIRHGTLEEFTEIIAGYEEAVRQHAEAGVDLIHPEGTPPFMLRGFNGEREIVDRWEASYGIPVFTSAMSQADALRALGVERFVGVGYDFEDMGIVAQYFRDAGFDVLDLDRPRDIPWEEINDLTSAQVYKLIEELHGRHPEAQGIYIQGSKWRVLDIVEDLEQALGVPVVHPVAARCWEMQKRLGIEKPQGGYGRLLSELPALARG
jgi:maleate cis-trans isomerase